MAAKDRHRSRLLSYLSNPENDFPQRKEYGPILRVSLKTLYDHFTPQELQELENEAYEIRKKNSTRQRAHVLIALYDASVEGNVSAAKEFLDRTEGKVAEKVEGDINVIQKISINRRKRDGDNE